MVNVKTGVLKMNKKLKEIDFQNAAKEIGVEIAAIKAVVDVESQGSGFLQDGRPKILFEAHIFSSMTNHIYDVSHPNISSRKWNKSLYKGGAREYDRLNEAILLNKIAALESASYGLFQIMGFNYKICGWNDVETFVNDMYKNEGEHLKAFAGFIKANKLEKHLQNKDWPKFAKGYNGPAYAQNKYDIKMREAYEKYVKQVIVEEKKPEVKEDDIPKEKPFDFGGGKFGGDGTSGDY